MWWFMRFGAAAAAAVGCVSSAGASPARAIDGDAALADVALMERVLTVLHPGYDRYTPRAEMDAAFDTLSDRVRGGTTDAEMFLEVSRVLERIRCDHTKAELPERLRAWREENASHLPVRVHIFGGRLYAGTNRVKGLDRGDEILSINGVPAGRLIEQTESLVSIDGWTEHARSAEAELSGEYLGSGLDTFMPLIHGWSGSFEFVVVASGGAERVVTGDAITYPAFVEMVRSGERAATDFADAVSVERPDERTAVLAVDTFINYRRPVDPEGVFGPIMRQLNEQGVEHLIVDLRANGGGSTDAAFSLLRHLIAEPMPVSSGTLVRTVPIPQDVKDAVTTWDRSALDATRDMFECDEATGLWRMLGEGSAVATPADDRFRGRVTALSSRANASGTTMLLAALQQRAGVRIVGEPTGGSVEGPTAGVIAFCALPASGVRVRVPLVRTDTGLEPGEPGMGVVPDVRVEVTAAGFFAGRDEVLEAALGG
ncbi:MAG: S41 family peptidase [Phycisphaerales bacterium]